MRNRRPLPARLAGALAIGVALLLVLPPTSLADTVEGMTVGPNQELSAEYGPILAQDPVTPTALTSVPPDQCDLLPTCNVVPIDFTVPAGASGLDTYIAQIDVSWETFGIGDQNVGESSDDLDIWLWAAEWLQKDSPGQPCYVPPDDAAYEPPEYCGFPLAHAANTGPVVPETVRADVNSHAHYLLVVNNSTGINTGYTVTVASRFVAYSAPVESTEGGFLGSADGSVLPPSGAFGGSSPAGGVAPQLSPSAGVPGSSGLSPFASIPGADEDLTNLTGTDIDAALRGPLIKRTSSNFAPPEPVTNSTVVFWLVLVPLVLLGAGATWLLRHRPAALRVGRA
jgi:hypothetical protein